MIIILSLNNQETSVMDNLNVLGENTEKYKDFSVLKEKEGTKIDKDGNESVITISYKIKFIDSTNLWQVHYQILLIISQKEILKLKI